MKSVAIILLTLLKTVEPAIKISMSRGAYFEKLENTKVYEKSIPLIYKINIPEIPNIDDINLTITTESELRKVNATVKNIQEYNMIATTIWKTNDLIQDTTKITRAMLEEFKIQKGDRRKRGVQFIGDAAHWCCNILTEREGHNYDENMETLQNKYENLRKFVIDEHATLFNNTNELEIFAKDTERRLDSIKEIILALIEDRNKKGDKIIEEIKGILEITQLNFNIIMDVSQKIRYLTQNCKANTLPSAIIAQKNLEKDLNLINKKIKDIGFTTVMTRSEEIKNYFRSKLIHCKVTDNILEIELKVPIKTKKANYEIYNFKPLHFRSHTGQICKWDEKDILLLNEDKLKITRIISGTDLDLCNKKEILCHIPQHRAPKDAGSCARSLFLQKSYEEIKKTCLFKCENNHQNLIVDQIEEELFSVTNAKNPIIFFDKVTKDREERTINETWPGTMLLSVPCNFEVRQIVDNKEKIIIPGGFPCLKEEKEIKIEHHLPIIWTNYDFVEMDASLLQSFRFPNMTIAYNLNWQNKVPHFQPLKSTDEIRKNLTEMQLRFENKTTESLTNPIIIILIIWNVLLTFGLLLVIGVYIITLKYSGIAKEAVSAVSTAENVVEHIVG